MYKPYKPFRSLQRRTTMARFLSRSWKQKLLSSATEQSPWPPSRSISTALVQRKKDAALAPRNAPRPPARLRQPDFKSQFRMPPLDQTLDPSVDPDTLLLSLLKQDLKAASKLIQKFYIDLEGTYKPFEFISEEGCSNVVLRRRIGNEEITVQCVLVIEEPDESQLEEPQDEIEITESLSLNVRISKQIKGVDDQNDGLSTTAPYLQLMGFYVNDKIVIQEVAYVDKSATNGGSFPYYGPAFEDLNENLQHAFHDILKTRGFDVRLAKLVMDHLSSKYQSEYLLWVQKLRSFLKK